MNLSKMENPPPPEPEIYYLGKIITELSKDELLEALRYCVKENKVLMNKWRDAEMDKIEWMGISSKLKFGRL